MFAPASFGVGRPLARIDTVNAHFRSLRSARVSNRQKALAMAAMLWELTFALECYVKLPEADLPAVAAGTSPADAAAVLRRHGRLPGGPVKHLVATAESRGIVVVERPLGEIDAVCVFSASRTLGPAPCWEAATNLNTWMTGRFRPIPDLAAPAAAILVLLDDENPFLSEQDDVFIAEHASSAASANGLPVETSWSMWENRR